jgi:hypothetical protein
MFLECCKVKLAANNTTDVQGVMYEVAVVPSRQLANDDASYL